MDGHQFDELTERLGNLSRRQAMKVLGGSLLGVVFGGLRAGTALAGPPQKHCKFQGYQCRRNEDCCSLECCNRVCCGQGQSCCGGQCVACAPDQVLNTNTCVCETPPPDGGGGNGGGGPSPTCQGFCITADDCPAGCCCCRTLTSPIGSCVSPEDTACAAIDC